MNVKEFVTNAHYICSENCRRSNQKLKEIIYIATCHVHIWWV